MFEVYSRQIFIYVSKTETINTLRIRYLSIVVIDANNYFIPASESCLVMVAGDNANRTLKQNIVDIIHRTGG